MASGPKRLSRERGAPASRHQKSLGSSFFASAGTTRALRVLVGAVGGNRGRAAVQSPTSRGKGQTMKEEEEEAEDLEDVDDDEEVEEEGEAPKEAATDGEPDGEVESSLEELIAKKEDRKPAEEEDDDDSVLTVERDERLEPLAVKVVPPQPTEFVCKRCHLVKHRSQLKDRAKQLCRDCA